MEQQARKEISQPLLDLLSHPDVANAYALVVETVSQVNLAKKKAKEERKDQAEILLDMTHAFTDSQAAKIKEYMDSNDSELSPEERTELLAINDLLAENISQLQPFFDIDGPLFCALKDNLTFELIEKGLPDDEERNKRVHKFSGVIEQQMTHYQEVCALSREVDPRNTILALAAIVHDSAKYVSGAHELGLHELLSTITGPQLVGAVLEQLKNEDGTQLLKSEQIDLVKKFIMRAIFTHGYQEFPTVKSNEIVGGRTDVREVFGGLIPVPDKTSIPDHQATIVSDADKFYFNSIAILNCVDMSVGSNNSSLKKYLNTYTTQFDTITARESIQDFVSKDIFASFESNLSGDSYLYLEGNADSMLISKLESIRHKDMVQGGLFLLLVGIPLSDFFNPVKDKILPLYEKSNLKLVAQQLETQFIKTKALFFEVRQLVEKEKGRFVSSVQQLVKSTTMDASYNDPRVTQQLLFFKEAVQKKRIALTREQDLFKELFIQLLDGVSSI